MIFMKFLKLNILEVTLVSNFIWFSGVQQYNSTSVHSVVCLPPMVWFPSLTIYLNPWSTLPFLSLFSTHMWTIIQNFLKPSIIGCKKLYIFNVEVVSNLMSLEGSITPFKATEISITSQYPLMIATKVSSRITNQCSNDPDYFQVPLN